MNGTMIISSDYGIGSKIKIVLDQRVVDNISREEKQYNEVYNTLGEPSKDIEKIEEYNNSIFWSFNLSKYRKANWWIKTASTDIKDKITIRTANTIRKVLELSKR